MAPNASLLTEMLVRGVMSCLAGSNRSDKAKLFSLPIVLNDLVFFSCRLMLNTAQNTTGRLVGVPGAIPLDASLMAKLAQSLQFLDVTNLNGWMLHYLGKFVSFDNVTVLPCGFPPISRNENLADFDAEGRWGELDWADPTTYDDLLDVASSWGNGVNEIADHAFILSSLLKTGLTAQMFGMLWYCYLDADPWDQAKDILAYLFFGDDYAHVPLLQGLSGLYESYVSVLTPDQTRALNSCYADREGCATWKEYGLKKVFNSDIGAHQCGFPESRGSLDLLWFGGDITI